MADQTQDKQQPVEEVTKEKGPSAKGKGKVEEELARLYAKRDAMKHAKPDSLQPGEFSKVKDQIHELEAEIAEG